MTFQEVSSMIGEFGIDYAYYQFAKGTDQATPFVCFFYSDNNDLLADDSNYQKIENLNIELYTDEKDFTLEAQVEAVLSDHGMVWSRSETYLDDEKMYEVIYEMDVVITAGG